MDDWQRVPIREAAAFAWTETLHLTLWQLTTRDDRVPPDAIPIGPGEWLHIGPDDGGFTALANGCTALARDMTAAYRIFEIEAPDPMAALGLDAHLLSRGPAVTRLAHIRVALKAQAPDSTLLCIVERPDAGWFRHWLHHRQALPAA